MKKVTFTRHLKGGEIGLAGKVFLDTLPPWNEIGITNGLGVDDTVWTHPKEAVPFLGRVAYKYYINFGNAADFDLSTAGTLSTYVPGYPYQTPDVFIHELTHVWQFSRSGANWGKVAARCIYAQKIGAGYSYTAGDTWSDYNFEQQAHIVENWNERSRGKDGGDDDELFPYIHYIIRRNRKYWTFSDEWFADEADLAQLKVLLDGERVKEPVELLEPIRITAKDDSFGVVLNGDVLFDFNKYGLKPGADKPLEQAWSKIKSNPSRRVIYINGYTDSVGEDRYNIRLSEQRAESVAQWFVTRGYLTPSIVRTQGFGKSNPVAPNTTREGRAKNRRVEIYLSNQ